MGSGGAEIGSVVLTVSEAVEYGERFAAAAPNDVVAAVAVLAAHYLVAGLLLTAWPGFSRRVTDTIVGRPLRAAFVGTIVIAGISALAILSYVVLQLAGPFLVFALVWLPTALLALVYVSVAITRGTLSLVGVDSRYVAVLLSGLGPLAWMLAPRAAMLDLLFVAVLAIGGGAVACSAWDGRRGAAR